MTNKQIKKFYEEMHPQEKIERLEFFAKLYLDYLDLGLDVEKSLMIDVVEYYDQVKKEMEEL